MLGTASDTLNLKPHKPEELIMRSIVKEKVKFTIINVAFCSFVCFGFYSFFVIFLLYHGAMPSLNFYCWSQMKAHPLEFYHYLQNFFRKFRTSLGRDAEWKKQIHNKEYNNRSKTKNIKGLPENRH